MAVSSGLFSFHLTVFFCKECLDLLRADMLNPFLCFYLGEVHFMVSNSCSGFTCLELSPHPMEKTCFIQLPLLYTTPTPRCHLAGERRFLWAHFLPTTLEAALFSWETAAPAGFRKPSRLECEHNLTDLSSIDCRACKCDLCFQFGRKAVYIFKGCIKNKDRFIAETLCGLLSKSKIFTVQPLTERAEVSENGIWAR